MILFNESFVMNQSQRIGRNTEGQIKTALSIKPVTPRYYWT